MFLDGDGVVCSPSDVTAAVACEFAWLRRLDEKLGRIEPLAAATDPMWERTARLGDAHERRVLDGLVERYGAYDERAGTGVFRLDRPSGGRDAIEAAAAQTSSVLRGGADVVYQAAFYRPGFLGYADFLIRDAEAGTWAVYDTKLARHAKVPALLQIAAYADELHRLGLPVAPQAHLLLGDGSVSSHRIADILPVYRERRAKLDALVAEHVADGEAARWRDPRYAACGRCDACAAEVEAHRDLLLVANMRATQRAKLIDAGIDTIDGLAANACSIPGMSARTTATLTAQARLQVAQHPPGSDPDAPPNSVTYEVFDTGPLAALPAPDSGDIFFDFEGDPLFTDADPSVSGLEYLFGVVESPIGDGDLAFRPFWAHDRVQERQALIDFLGYVATRRATHPAMHIYHYAAYERSALLRLAGRYGVGEDQVDNLLRNGVLVDLYSTVRQSLRISQPSYSIKKLEPLYMGDELRVGDVTTAGDSIVAYAHYCDLRDTGDAADAAAADGVLAEIADYNRYDCLSTLRLRDWLLGLAAQRGVSPASVGRPLRDGDGDGGDGDSGDAGGGDGRIDANADLRERLVEGFADLPREARTPPQQARALLAASLGYHQREEKPFWWAHFDRLQQPVDEWADTTGVLVAERVEVVADWAMTGRQRKPHRGVRLTGDIGGGVDLAGTVFALYEPDALPAGRSAEPGYRGCCSANVVDCDGSARTVVIDEISATDGDGGAALPMALTPGRPVDTRSLREAIVELATAVADGTAGRTAVLDLLERRAPRLVGGGQIPHADGPPGVDLLTETVAALDDSYLAIQGPPGSGKTYTGARIVARLIDRGWTVGVVAQSHRVVENFLDAVSGAGVPAGRIGKKSDATPTGWTALGDKAIAPWLAGRRGAGCVIGGTAWDFVNTHRIERGGLDLLVVDEAGQFSLANTIAVSGAARRLLLLGDPQQLPQVSQGTHPEPCEESALAWVMAGHAVMPPDRGYFLSRTWRMHPALCAAVSTLSYDGELAAQESVTAARHLAGPAAGIHVVEVHHEGNATSSPEEARAVVRQVVRLLGTRWSAPDEEQADRPLGQGDILVVAAYNAQVTEIRRALDGAGHLDVRVGTVDKFQGQQAPVVIVSLAASTPAEVPRGMGFLLNRNRINVAISRAQWCTVIVRSPRLTDYLPSDPAALAELGAFIGLCGGGT